MAAGIGPQHPSSVVPELCTPDCMIILLLAQAQNIFGNQLLFLLAIMIDFDAPSGWLMMHECIPSRISQV